MMISRAMFLDIVLRQEPFQPHPAADERGGRARRFLPEFGRIVGRTQFNMHHHFTVDEHTLKAVETIHDIERGTEKDLHPLSAELFPKILQPARALSRHAPARHWAREKATGRSKPPSRRGRPPLRLGPSGGRSRTCRLAGRQPP